MGEILIVGWELKESEEKVRKHKSKLEGLGFYALRVLLGCWV